MVWVQPAMRVLLRSALTVPNPPCPADYACLIVGANAGVVGMCKEHLGVALALKVRPGEPWRAVDAWCDWALQ